MNTLKLSAMVILLPISIASLAACSEREAYNSQTSPSAVATDQEAAINHSTKAKQNGSNSKIDAEIFDYEAEKFIEANKN